MPRHRLKPVNICFIFQLDLSSIVRQHSLIGIDLVLLYAPFNFNMIVMLIVGPWSNTSTTIIIIIQFVTQHNYVEQGELTNRSCGPATAVSDGMSYGKDVF